jgi:WD40 repeat protein
VTRVLEEVLDLRRRLYDRDHVGYSLPLQRFFDESVTYAETVIDAEDSASAVDVRSVANMLVEEDDNHQTPQLMDNTVTAHRALFTLYGHSRSICQLVFSPDGALLASQTPSGEGGVQLWRMSTGVLEATISKDWTTALSFSRNGRMLSGVV